MARRELTPWAAGITLVLAVAAWALRIPIVTPVIWFGTLVHETGHALAAEVTGGTVVSLTINEHGGGVTRHRGPAADWRTAVIASSGYLATVAAGAGLVVASGRLKDPMRLLLPLALAVLLVAVLWVPWTVPDLDAATTTLTGTDGNDGRFTWLFCVVTSGICVATAYAPRRFGQLTLLFLGAVCLLVGLDSLRELIGWSFGGGHSDAETLADVWWLPSWFWATAWTGIGVVVAVWALRRVADDWDLPAR